jgi:hypothetical protein
MSKLRPLATAAAALILAAPFGASRGDEAACVRIATAAATREFPAAAGDLLQIAFAHSIYGSRVEETFRITGGGFNAVDVRYSEPRLVEFYGYESAMRAGDWWVVRPANRVFNDLAVRASRDARLSINFGRHTIAVNDGAGRIALVPCSRAANG